MATGNSRNNASKSITEEKEEKPKSNLIAVMSTEEITFCEEDTRNDAASDSNTRKSSDVNFDEDTSEQSVESSNNYSDDDSNDSFVYIKRRTTRSLKRKASNDTVSSNKIPKVVIVSGKPKTTTPKQLNSGPYDATEKQLLLEALELYGRDWDEVQNHVGTRNLKSIQSRVRTYFTDLYIKGLPLPKKVKESGKGYTLSGRGFYKKSNTANSSAKPRRVRGLPKSRAPSNDLEKITEGLRAICTTNISDETELTSRSKSSANLKFDNRRRTRYSLSRLRDRQGKAVKDNKSEEKDVALDPFTMIQCDPFAGIPGSDDPDSQPFKLSVNSNALLGMDFHAHLMSTEIIGFLAGKWDKRNKSITVMQAFPCQSLETGQNDVNVEMDPTSAIETIELIEARNMTAVGWYHSHPTFIPNPSLIDIENQQNYQNLYRDYEGDTYTADSKVLKPFVGAIVSPFSPTLSTSISDINWFYVCNTRDDRVAPKQLDYKLQESDYISQDEVDLLFELFEVYRNSSDKVDFTKKWRRYDRETYLEKMIKSVSIRMPWIHDKIEDGAILDEEFLLELLIRLKNWDGH